MQKGRSRFGATAIMAVLISGWHAPLFFMPVFEAHPIGFVTTVAVTFWYAWLFNHAAGSLSDHPDRPRVSKAAWNQQSVGRRGPGTPQLDLRNRVVPGGR